MVGLPRSCNSQVREAVDPRLNRPEPCDTRRWPGVALGTSSRRVCQVPSLCRWGWPLAIVRGHTAGRGAEPAFPDQRAWSAGAARRQARPATGRCIVSRETEPVSRHVTNAWPEDRISGSAQRIVTAGHRREAQEWRFGLRKCLFRRDADRDEDRRAESARHSGAVPSFRDGETVACERSRGEHSTIRVVVRD